MKTPICYYGGKQKIARRIVELLRCAPRWTTYIEPFAGGAAVFFEMYDHAHGKRFVLNDKNALISNFYEVASCAKSRKLLIAMARCRGIMSESFFADAQRIWCMPKKDARKVSPIKKAWAVFYLSRAAQGSNFDASFQIVNEEVVSRRYERILQTSISSLPDVLAALEGSYILCRDAVDVLKKYDYKSALIYADPPYVGSCMGHYSDYSEDDYARLLEFFSQSKSHFVLSSYMNPWLEEAIAANGWNVEKIPRKATAMPCKRGAKLPDRVEILAYNFSRRAGGLV